MKRTSALLALLAAQPPQAQALSTLPDGPTEAEVDAAFAKWQQDFGKNHTDLNPSDRAKAKRIFRRRFVALHLHNEKFELGEVSWRMRLTQFADRDDEYDLFHNKTGFRERVLPESLQPLRKLTRQSDNLGRRLNDAADFDGKDWEPFIGAVQNQGSCQTCWAFTTSATIVGAFQMWQWASHPQNSYPQTWLSNRFHSVQQMMDCDAGWPSSDDGTSCALGGSVEKALSWVASKGVALEADQPYKAKDKTCDMTPMKTKLSCNRGGRPADGCGSTSDNPYYCPKASSFGNSRYVNELKEMLLLAPVSVALRSCALPSGYAAGVLPWSNCGSRNDHAVTLIGYGWDAATGETYWKMRNSWGTSWGESGNFRIVQAADVAGIKQTDPCIPLGPQYY